MTGAFAIIAGGGTAGHVHPGLAIAEALVARGHARERIHYVGSERGMERELVPEAGFPLTLLPGRGIQRRLTLQTVASVWGLLRALVRSVGIVGRLRPRVVVSLGGYASVACAVAAGLWRVPVVVAEQNAVPGAANRLVSRWAKASAVSFPGTDLRRAVVTGNPVRPEMLAIDRTGERDTARRRLGVGDGRALLVVYGGSLGARRLNQAAAEAAELWADRCDLSVRHIIGTRDWDQLTRPAVDRLEYRPIRYEDDMRSVFTAADLVVCRAGASSVVELAAAAVPSILVPLPGAPGDHQTANAMAMVEVDAAVLLPDADLSGPRLQREVDSLLGDPGRLAAMGAAASTVARPDAADAVAGLAEEWARV